MPRRAGRKGRKRQRRYKGAVLWRKPLLTTGEVAKLLGMSRETVRLWCKTGKLKAIRTPGGQYRIPRSELEKMVEAGRGGSRASQSQDPQRG